VTVLSSEHVTQALEGVIVPRVNKSVVALGVVQDVSVNGGRVSLLLDFNIPAYASKSELKAWVSAALERLPGVGAVEVKFVAGPKPKNTPPPKTAPRTLRLPQVGCVVAVFSGKGGVGKSTVSANLAVALTVLGERVGLFDADMHGPSIPKVMGITERPQMDKKTILPLERHGVKTMSVGYMVNANEPLIWRGPMLTKGINELLEGTRWGALDFLILDLPPGTGDVQLGLAQDVRLDGAIAVTTPQDVALDDVHRGINTFKKLEVPVWGIVENMAYFVCPGCGSQTEIFGHGGGQKGSEQHGIPLLGQLPLVPELCRSGDAGQPLVSSQPQHPASLTFKHIAAQIVDMI